MVTYCIIPSILHFEITEYRSREMNSSFQGLTGRWRWEGSKINMVIKGQHEECL